MARKRDELKFGSDSFLDVLANMVGILIILIVIAGVRAGSEPMPSVQEIMAEIRRTSGVVPTAETTALGADPSTATTSAGEVVPEAENASPPPEVADKRAALEAELAALAAKSNQRAEELEFAATKEAELQRLRETEEERIARKTTLLTEVRQRTEQASVALLVNKDRLTGLLAESEQVAASGGKVEKIVHRTTPISQEVSGNELHFRLAEQKVAVIPLDGLLERLKSQVERQKQTLQHVRSHQGSVGPVEGFQLQYLIERQAASQFDEIRHGPGVFRIGVSAWKLIPEPDLDAETADQALRRNSRFAAALRAAPPDATITLWVYPDSFALFRRLQAAAHAEGFTVAARPLPQGVPIAGSPSGSRSAGQ
jgi:hypothetical protein